MEELRNTQEQHPYPSKMKFIFLTLLIISGITYTRSDRYEVVGPADTVFAVAGEDVILPCSVKPNISVVDMKVRWSRLDLKDFLVHLYEDHEDRNTDQIQSYRGRTKLNHQELQRGNASLKLSSVQVSDEGRYKCFIQSKSWFDDATVDVSVEAVGRPPVITVDGFDHSERLRLQCESEGWYPEPVLEWLDSEGVRLSSETTEMQRNTDGFSVKHTITVQHRDDKIHCRVKLRHHMLETLIVTSSKSFNRWRTSIILSSVAVVLIVMAGILLAAFVRKTREHDELQNENERKKRDSEFSSESDQLQIETNREQQEFSSERDELQKEKDRIQQEFSSEYNALLQDENQKIKQEFSSERDELQREKNRKQQERDELQKEKDRIQQAKRTTYINPHWRRNMDEPLRMSSRHDAILLKEGPLMLYHLNTERKYIDGTDKKVRQWTYGRRDRNKLNKVILMVGETGTGKTTIINTMVNYLLGVKFEDQEFYYITEENEDKDQSQSQTSAITVYEVFVEENPTSLTIIDTPGYADTEGYEKDRDISESLIRLFSDEDGIHYIDAVCFVMKASQNRLSDKEYYIFHSVLSLFGRDIENNIVFLLTYSSECPPDDALNAIKKAEIPCRRDENNEPVYFLFNNQQEVQINQKFGPALKSAWEMGEESINELFTLLDEKNRTRVQKTINVLKERRQLEARVSNLVDKISEKELKTNELNGIQEALRQNRDKTGNWENFQFTIKRAVREKVSIENEWWWNSKATCCSICEENCHEWNCSWAKDPSTCWVMKNNHCTVCTKKCHHEKHVKEGKKYVTNIREVIITFDELKKECENTCEKQL